MLICYHDDFDGMASAALLAKYLHDARWKAGHRFQVVDWDLKEAWLQPELPFADQEPIAIVDFAYHPTAKFFWDHHRTSFLSDEYRAHYDRTPHIISRYDPTYPSCAELIYASLGEVWPEGWSMTHLVHAATKIDAARYESVVEYFESCDPALQINRAWRELSPGQKDQLIRLLAASGGDLVHALASVASVANHAWTVQRSALGEYERYTHQIGAVAMVDLIGKDVPFLRFAPYYYHADAEYVVAVMDAEPGTVAMSLGKNPWRNPTDGVDLGALARGFGGGGHSYAAGVSFTANGVPASLAARRAAGEVIRCLNEATQWN